MGMTHAQFWFDEPELVIPYREAEKIRRRRKNEELWLAGIYVAHALEATVGNMFAKGSKAQYPTEPIPITAAEQQERREREQRIRMERIKSAFTARALKMNASMGGKADDKS